MNPLLKNYCVSVEFPDVSGAGHLEISLKKLLKDLESRDGVLTLVLLLKKTR